MKTQFWGPLVILSLAFQLSACSSSGKKDESAAGDIPAPAGDAGTDAVPRPAAEGDQAAASGASSASSASNAGSGVMTDYTVQTGDTLMKIAFETYGDVYRWKSILDANKDTISDPKILKKGTILKVETPASPLAVDRNGEKYLIKDGDTLGKISGAVYGSPSKWKQIWENNKQLIHDPNKIFAGFYLYYLSDGSGTKLAADGSSVTAASGQAAGQVGDLNSAASALSAAQPAAQAVDQAGAIAPATSTGSEPALTGAGQ